ncbi:hypothetical protein SAMN05421819_0762 [Bryocella elongata]|uniref:CAAX prenyl protease 2/Lysostaphin resistance protein A-like domain-containing protein n=2 Tax=Bryocella elongata TaxID=863522 RepID=A0A1H5TW53_9BACT|nr:hypothetical protein SAMN05421819_0762 [Bryocella elongata]
MQVALFVTGLLWMFAARAVSERSVQIIATQLNLPLFYAPLQHACLAALLAVGFAALNWLGTRRGGVRESNALPSRSTVRQEWSRGFALGWGMVLFALLPLVLFGGLGPSFLFTPSLLGRSVLAILTLAFSTLATELAFRGFLYQRLTAAIGIVGSTFLMALFYAFFCASHPNATAFTFIVTFLFGLFYSVAWQRTHALWVGWGVHFAWSAVAGVIFGLPVAGYSNYSTLVQSATSGYDFLTGGAYGLEGSLVAAVAVCLGLPVLYRITRDYAWHYTAPEIIAAGYAMEVAPPPAHAAMEAQAKPAPLVQIASITPAGASTLVEANDLLRREREARGLPGSE